jgi:hypothetical protein
VSLELGALAVQATFELSASVHRKTLRNAMRRIDAVHTFFGDLEIELSSLIRDPMTASFSGPSAEREKLLTGGLETSLSRPKNVSL